MLHLDIYLIWELLYNLLKYLNKKFILLVLLDLKAIMLTKYKSTKEVDDDIKCYICCY